MHRHDKPPGLEKMTTALWQGLKDIEFRWNPPSDPYYKYEPLRQGHIRLVKIDGLTITQKHSHHDHDVHLSMFTFPIGSCPEYDALSYTWGDPETHDVDQAQTFTKVDRCFPLRCDDRILRGTSNLRAALRRLRELQSLEAHEAARMPKGDSHLDARYGKAQFYWIDALCINQDDLLERAEQVLLMGKIYKQAQATWVWLGELGKNGRVGLGIAIRIFENVTRVRLHANANIVALHPEVLELLNLLGRDESLALFEFFARTWFYRVWILQEAVLSSRLLGLCGQLVFSFEMLLTVGASLSHERQTINLFGHALQASRARSDPSSGVAEAPRTPFMILSLILHCRNALTSGEDLDLPTVMMLTLESESTDPRDRVYAMLPLMSDLQEDGRYTIRPDYKKDVHEIYIDTTIALVRNRNDLLALSFCSGESDPSAHKSPSWCPQYSARRGAATYIKPFDAGRRWTIADLWVDCPKIKFSKNKILVAHGFCYDTVGRVVRLRKDKNTSNQVDQGVSALLGLALALFFHDDDDQDR